MATTKSPWAVLLCKVKSDATGQFDPKFEPPNAAGVLPFRTVCDNFFTKTNAGFNAVRFFSDMSHGNLDLSGSQVLGWYTLEVNITGYTAAGDPILDKTQGEVVALARQAAINAGVSLNPFVAVVVIMNLATGWAQGAPGWMAADWRRVDGRNFDGTLGPRATGGGNGMEVFGQEMGHGYGLGHSRRDGSDEDYQDMWDTMSTLNAFSTPDPDYCARGPSLNAWNMRGRGWLDESRVWQGTGQAFSETVQLRPLHRRDLSGWLAAELPSNGGKSPYLVEFRTTEGWDAGISKSTVLVHRYLTENQDNDGWPHSYLMRGTKGQFSLVAGDEFVPGANGGMITKLEVLSIDENSKTATVRLSYLPVNPALAEICVTKNADGRLEVFALGKDKSVYHIWQTAPNGGWSPWSFLGGHDLRQITVGRNADGRLELFALGGDRAVYHIWQTAPNGDWGQWAGLAGHDIQQIIVGNNADGRLELFALGGDKAAYHIWQSAPNGNWGQWAGLAGHDLRQLSVGNNADGRLELFALGGDRAVYHIWQAAPNGNWGQWAGLAGHDIQQIIVGNNADGRVELFALGGDKAAYHIWQTTPNGNWGQWAGLAGHDLQQITVGKNADGRLELFALGGDRAVYHIWQTAPNGNWGQWASLAGHDIQQINVESNADGRLELFALGGDARPYHRWQAVPNGQWKPWFSIV